MRTEIRDEARGRWAGLLPIDRKLIGGKHGPCPMCGGKDRFRFDNKEGNGTWICSQCGAGDGMKLFMELSGMSFAQAAADIREKIGGGKIEQVAAKPALSADRQRRDIEHLWQGGKLISADDDAGKYLMGRGFTPPFPRLLRFNPSVPVTGHPRRKFLPAMLAPVYDRNRYMVTIHRTYLENGQKAQMDSPRRLMPCSLPEDGVFIPLGGTSPYLGAAEGIETAMAVTRDRGIVCWSCINADQLAKFRPPPGTSEYHVYGDNDPKFAGQAAAYQSAHRSATMRDAPRVEVHIPYLVGTDWADAENKGTS